jgi:CBS domain-containing protein
MKLRDVMTPQVATISSRQTIVTAAARMRELGIGSLVVLRDDDVEGIITTWDLTAGCLGAGHDPHECVVFTHMSTPVHTGDPDTDILEAAHSMAERHITRMPIVDGEKLVGIVSLSNMSQAMDRLTQDLLRGWTRPE